MWRWCLNSKQAALQLRVEDSRRDERGQKKLPTPDSHVDGENGSRTTVYNTKKNEKGKGTEKEKQEKSERLNKCNSKKKEFHIIDHTISAYPKMLFVFLYE